jgi:hypothetical protein
MDGHDNSPAFRQRRAGGVFCNRDKTHSEDVFIVRGKEKHESGSGQMDKSEEVKEVESAYVYKITISDRKMKYDVQGLKKEHGLP